MVELEVCLLVMSGVVLFVSVCVERWHRLSHSPYFDSSEQSVTTLGMIVALGVIAFLMVFLAPDVQS